MIDIFRKRRLMISEKEQIGATVRFLEIPDGGRVLDLSFGNDILLRALEQRGAVLYGADISEGEFQRTIDTVALCGMTSVYELPYNDGFFDAVTTVETPSYWQEPEKALREIMRVLRPGGQLICGYTCDQARKDKGYIFRDPKELRRNARAAGLRDVRVRVLKSRDTYLLTAKKAGET